MIAKPITYFSRSAVVMCDARCHKAWGATTRPSERLSDDPDDVVFLADDELPIAPVDPGTYEGGDAKPCFATERLNKWCVRACERSLLLSDLSEKVIHEMPDWSRRRFNLPSRS